MKKIILLASLLLPVAAAGQGQNIGTFHFSDQNNDHAATLVVTTKAFVRSEHQVTFASEEYLKKHGFSPTKGVFVVTKIDGRKPLGTDGEIPRVGISSMVVSFRGKRTQIPRSLYTDCFNPNFKKTGFVAKLNDAGDALFVFMAGSDGAGGYEVMWTLRRDGHHSRFVHDCSDCRFADILLFLRKQ